MKILLASSEVHPYSKTGGLADMVGALGKALARAGHTVGIVTPLSLGIRERYPEMQKLPMSLVLPLGQEQIKADVWSLDQNPNRTLYFVDQPAFFQRPGLYQEQGANYPDNARRFIFLSKAVAHLALHLPWQPEVLHVHDWQTGLAALFIAHERKRAAQGNGFRTSDSGLRIFPRTCMTIHNLAYQGLFPAADYALTNLPWDYFTLAGAEFYGQLSCLKAGIAYGDVLTTVSPRYAREITTPEFGCGMDGLLRQRQSSLFGILNGVDYEEWNTVNNPCLKHSYSVSDLSGKTANKLALQEELGLPQNERVPLFGNIGRMVEQKGVELLHPALMEMLQTDLQYVMLGTGNPSVEKAFEELARRFPNKAAVRVGFDEGLSHRIEAGCDFFLMPSQFEPCGLNQMYSLRYGTIPIVRATGGLDDTITDIRQNVEKADGIKFDQYSAPAFSKAIRKAVALYDQPELFHNFQVNAMNADFSWDRTAAEYVQVYERAGQGR
ncbi:MAG: glycogen synthase GlgA [Verrucomicrobia bacterium]|nr:MAG: glycogen synthase GlgA [Verrucomicrobiota bacterium]